MNLQQLEYILAVDKERHFVKAAESCFVTQATLSQMIKKLEEELNVIIFDRSKQPVIPTETGEIIIEQARRIVLESKKLKEMVLDLQQGITGEIHIGIIPTVAPYLLPLFLGDFIAKYPKLKIFIRENTTEEIIEGLQKGTIDFGILATPLKEEGLKEEILYYEQFLVFTSSKDQTITKQFLQPQDLDTNRLLLLEEGHCLRSQIINICALQKSNNQNLDYEAGSIESLVNIAEAYNGITIVPELYLHQAPKHILSHIRPFKAPVPVREISLVTYRHFAKKKILEVFTQEIKEKIPRFLKSNSEISQIVSIKSK